MLKKRYVLSGLIIIAMVMALMIASTNYSHGATKNNTYWLKVNTERNVVTAYVKSGSKWKPVRAMLCSSGTYDTPTPIGTFHTQGKWNWGGMMGDVYGQYCTHITGGVLFHSVYYWYRGDYASQPTSEFNRLGSSASHGCVRLCTMDAKWIYDNCRVGTKVTIYRSSTSGPLGKPSPIRVNSGRTTYWDPTDPKGSNPYYLLRKPVIKVSSKKALTVTEGKKYNLKGGVSAKDPNTFMSLTSIIKVSKVSKYSGDKKRYVSSKFSTNKTGTYKVTYYVNDPYSGRTSKTIKIKVVHNLKAPKIKGASKVKKVTLNSKNAVAGVTAIQTNRSRTKAITTYIKKPGAKKYYKYSYNKAKKYIFTKTGTYNIKYVVKNAYKPYKSATKAVKIKVYKAPNIKVVSQKVSSGYKISMSKISITHNSGKLTKKLTAYITSPKGAKYSAKTYNKLKAFQFKTQGNYKVKIVIKNPYAPKNSISKTFTVTVGKPPVIQASNQSITAGGVINPSTISATHYTGNLTSKITAVITAPSKKKFTRSYETLKSFTFAEVGTYTISLSVTNPFATKEKVTKVINVVVTP